MTFPVAVDARRYLLKQWQPTQGLTDLNPSAGVEQRILNPLAGSLAEHIGAPPPDFLLANQTR